tara:strand:- start:213 stop:779 length:567 start_codon:yes stop_codon:yes gene_type:complete
MRQIFIIFFLVIIFQPWTKADDIRDFQIEGMSIGDNLLNHFNNKEISESKVDYGYKSKKYTIVEFPKSKTNSNKYDIIQIQFLTNDNKKIIRAISGVVIYKNINECHKQLKDTVSEISKLFKTWKSKGEDNYETTFGKAIDYSFANSSDDSLQIACFDYFDDNIYDDHLRISIKTMKYKEWLSKEIYG